MFTRYYDTNGKQVPAKDHRAFFWVQTEIDCDLVHSTFLASYLWSVVAVADGVDWPLGLSGRREFREWQKAQDWIAELLARGRR